MDAFQREVIDRLARIETKVEAMPELERRVANLERGESRRNAILGVVSVTIPAAIAAAVSYLSKGTPT